MIGGRIFRQLLRAPSREWHSGAPELGPPNTLDDPLWHVSREHVANRHNGSRATYFHGDLMPPIPHGPPPTLPPEPVVPLIVSDYGRARKGEGLFSVESLIPEGEVD